jgi:5,10-methylene-tetrahydrofolate dehydrogenase/methenyl tetrahydrofolate cyclohydrolase
VAYLPGDDVQQHDVRQAVQSMCKDPSIDGVLVQLPLPRHIDEEDVIEHFDPRKDVDGFHPLNVGRTLMRGRTASFVPCTALGCLELLQRSGVDVHHKTVVIVGDSNIVGMPLAMLFRDKGAGSVTIIHRSSFGTMRRGTSNDSNCGKGPVTYRAQETARRSVDDPPHPYKVTYSSTYEIHENPFSPEDVWNIKKITRTADILVIAVGYPELVTDTWIKPGAVVLDVGINSVHSSPMVDGHNESSVQVDGEEPMYEQLLEGVRNDQHLHSIVGDVDAASLMGKAGYLSPVPGGIGPMTVAALVHNTIASASWRLGVPFETS